MKMNLDNQIGQEELEKQKKFFEDQKSINAKLERDIEILDQTISELSIKMNREEQNRLQFQDEVRVFLNLIISVLNMKIKTSLSLSLKAWWSKTNSWED